MSLNGSLQIGRSALMASQTALQVAGDNMANAATPGFHRRTVHMSPIQGSSIVSGAILGRGVQVSGIRREVDAALQIRFRSAVSQEHASLINQRFLTALESLQNELTDNDLSTTLSKFFNSFSELANNPNDLAFRSVVIQQGQTLADRLASMRTDYNRLNDEINRTLELSVTQADDLLKRIAILNGEIVSAEIGHMEAASLRDQRDMLLDELAQYMDISVINHSGGSVDVLVGSTPVVLGAVSRGIEIRAEQVDGQHEWNIRVKADGTKLNVRSGAIGALASQRDTLIGPMIDKLDNLASQLIFQVNRLHSQGQGSKGFATVVGSASVASATAAMNSQQSGLAFPVSNGSFFIHVTNSETGVRTAHEIQVDGSMSLNDVIDQINTVVGVPHVTASLNLSGAGSQLELTATPPSTMSFSDDSSGVLAVLGINTFFTGTNAANIDVNQRLIDDPALLATGKGHVAGSNEMALAVAQMQDVSLQELNGMNLRQYWQNAVSDLAVKTSGANAATESAQMVRASLDAQIQSVSGVSLDEEAINLMMYQRQFQAAARFINVIDETLQILINL